MNGDDKAHPTAYGIGLGVGCLIGIAAMFTRYYTAAALDWAARQLLRRPS